MGPPTLGLDLGTSGVRAALVGADGTVLAAGAAPLADLADPGGWWRAATAALGALPGRGAARALAVAGTSGTLLALDRHGRPAGPALPYDVRAAAPDLARLAAAAPPGSPALGATSPLARAAGLARRPGAVRVLHQADWVAWRLRGGEPVTDANTALKTGADPVALRWPDWLAAAGLPPAFLPPVRAPGDALGPVAPDVAAALGLDPGCVVAAGTTDGCAAFLAAGGAAPGDAVTSLGSTLILKLASGRPVGSATHGVYSHRLGGLWLVGGASNSGGAALARHFSPARLAALSARLDPAHPSPLDYYPLPRAGERFPAADPRLAPRESPRPADDAAFLHGLLEGIARIEAAGYARLAALGAPVPTAVRSVGRGAANPAFTAIRARVLGLPLLPAASGEAAVGAARLARRALPG